MNATDNTTTDALTFAQTAHLLGVDAQTVRRWVRCEQCPVVMVGRARRIPESWVTAQPECRR